MAGVLAAFGWTSLMGNDSVANQYFWLTPPMIDKILYS